MKKVAAATFFLSSIRYVGINEPLLDPLLDQVL